MCCRNNVLRLSRKIIGRLPACSRNDNYITGLIRSSRSVYIYASHVPRFWNYEVTSRACCICLIKIANVGIFCDATTLVGEGVGWWCGRGWGLSLPNDKPAAQAIELTRALKHLWRNICGGWRAFLRSAECMLLMTIFISKKRIQPIT